jgi:hypothetical protein
MAPGSEHIHSIILNLLTNVHSARPPLRTHKHGRAGFLGFILELLEIEILTARGVQR